MNFCSRIKNKFTLLVLPFVVGIATSGLIFQFYYFLPSIQTLSTKIFLQTTAVLFYIMCFISYYFAIKIKNYLPNTLILPRIKSQLKNNHPIYTEKKQCQKQNNKFKPPRTSHCRSCKCVARMDHHCPYTDNCLGARNFKAFILFCFYGGIFAIQFMVLSVVYYYQLADGKASKISELTVTIWMILSFFSFFLALSMNGLWISNMYLAGKNITQLQMMKGIFFLNDRHQTHPNPYDLGYLTNWNIVFGGDYWLFWWPSQIKSINDFTQYPMRPPITSAQIKQLPQQIQKKLQDPLTKSLPKTLQQLRKRQQNNYQGVVFFYLGKAYKLAREEVKSALQQINNIKETQIQNEGMDTTLDKIQSKEDQEILADIYNG